MRVSGYKRRHRPLTKKGNQPRRSPAEIPEQASDGLLVGRVHTMEVLAAVKILNLPGHIEKDLVALLAVLTSNP